MIHNKNKLTGIQLELLKIFKHISNENQLKEIKSLLNFYFQKKLENAIESEEKKRNLSTETYEAWLNKTILGSTQKF